MPQARVPATSLPPPRRLFEPARYSQQYFACAYLQLVPSPRRHVLVSPAVAPATPAPRAGVAS
jgi:hypothetical protein